jgi:hypothetical protein
LVKVKKHHANENRDKHFKTGKYKQTQKQATIGLTFRILFCGSVSREMLRGRSSESTIPLTKLRYSGMRSSQLYMMKTRRTYSLMLLDFLRVSNMTKGARLGTKRTDLNSSCPSTEKCLTDRCSSQSLVSDL